MKSVVTFSIAYEPHIGGAEVAIREVAARLPARRFHIVTLRFDRADAPREERDNVFIRRIGPMWLPLLLRKAAYVPLAALYAWKHRREFDLAWWMMANYAGLAGVLFKVAYPRLPAVLTLQEGDDLAQLLHKVRWYRPLFNLMFKKAEVIQCISKYLADFARTLAPKARIEIVPNGVDVERFSLPVAEQRAEELRRELSISPGTRVLFTASRLVDKNGIDYVIEALPRLGDGIVFVIAGLGEREQMLKEQAERLGVSDRVRFVGFVPHERLPDYLSISDCFIRLSRTEGMGNSFVEAMAAGVPVVGTDAGGIVDFLTDNYTGRVVTEPSDPHEVARAVSECVYDTAFRATVVPKALELVRSRYEWRDVVRSMEDVFANATSR
jgi:glycosyltransferase involved in cell wall biosynthesis